MSNTAQAPNPGFCTDPNSNTYPAGHDSNIQGNMVDEEDDDYGDEEGSLVDLNICSDNESISGFEPKTQNALLNANTVQ